MCGIFAYTGWRKNALSLVVEGLKRLEYRGYDSWGVVTHHKGQLWIRKKVGKISQIPESDFKGIPSSIAMGHSRWATHGGVTDKNAHPHTDPEQTVVVIHNGIVENYLQLKKKLGVKRFITETDTEVIAHLIAHHAKTLSFQEAVMATCRQLKGRFAFVAMQKDSNALIAARSGSPLIVGVHEPKGKKPEYFLASDIPAFLKYTRTVKYLDDGEMVIISGGGSNRGSDSGSHGGSNGSLQFYDYSTGQRVEKRLVNIDWKAESAEKGEYDHFMLKEIMEQKETIQGAILQDEKEILRIAKMIKEARGTFFSGCGTAGKVCMAAEYFFAMVAHRHVNFAPASEFPIFHHFLRPESLLIVVSQSGETADVLEAMKAAKSKGAKVLSIVNAQGSTIARQSNFSLLINAGPEKAVASTKATTAQMALLLLIAYAVADRLHEGRQLLIELAAKINDMLNPRFLNYIKSVAQKIKGYEHTYIIGKAENYPMALEAAIKIQEVSYIHAQGFAAGELKHGPIALITKGFPCIALVANDEVKEDVFSNTIELKARGAYIIGISPERHDVFDEWIRVPDVGIASPIATIIPIQLLAYFLSVLRGEDPDMPRNLAKSVTVK